MKRLALAALLMIVLFSVADAQEDLRRAYVTGGRLAEWLKQSTSARYEEDSEGVNTYTIGKGWGYVIGILDSRTDEVDLPKGARLRDVMTIVARYLEAHPELSNEPASDLVIVALKEESERRAAGAKP